MLKDDLEEVLALLLDRYESVDAETRFADGAELNTVLLDAQSRVAAIRRAAVRELRSEGWTLQSIAELTGTTPQRVHQISIGFGRAEKKARYTKE
jgi:hypothetical protein